MDDQDVVQARLKEIMRVGQAGAEQLGEFLHRQHYDFAHKLVPYIIEERFDELISGLADNWLNNGFAESGRDDTINGL